MIRLLLFLAVMLGFRIGATDVKGAYMKSGPTTRDLYVRPPKELISLFPELINIIWKLLRLPYGVCEAGRQWAKRIEEWLLSICGFERVQGASQLYILRNEDGTIIMLLAKVTDDMLMAGSPTTMNEFISKLEQEFTLSKAIVNGPVIYNGCRITQDDDGTIQLSTEEYLTAISPINVNRGRRKEWNATATKREISEYRRLAGSLCWLGKAVLPQAALAGSILQQKIDSLKVSNLINANTVLKEVKDMKPTLRFNHNSTSEKCRILTFSDASFNISSKQVYGQTGIITGIAANGEHDIPNFYPIDWISAKQRRVTHSSYGAEILACEEGDDRGYNLKTTLQSIGKE